MCIAVLDVMPSDRYVSCVHRRLIHPVPLVATALMLVGCDNQGSTSAHLADADPLPTANPPGTGLTDARDGGLPVQEASAVGGACIDGSLRWGQTGGDTAYDVLSHLEPCSVFECETVPGFFNLDPNVSCTQDVTTGAEGIGVPDINFALSNADVQSSFADAPIQYGLYGSTGGGIFRVIWNDASISVGADCNGLSTCLPTPGGVAVLVDLLKRLTIEQLEQEPCSDVFDGPLVVSATN
jgi:hypothetical protein